MATYSLTLAHSKPKDKFLTLAACSVFFLVCAQFKIFTPFSPVPISMHTFAVLVLGCLLPFRQALGCFLVYFIEGIFGSPLLGQVITLGPSFGYIIGMAVSLFLLSKLSKNVKFPLLLSLIVANTLIWGIGVFHLGFFIGSKNALWCGIVPFIVGDFIKIFAAYGLIQIINRNRLKIPSI